MFSFFAFFEFDLHSEIVHIVVKLQNKYNYIKSYGRCDYRPFRTQFKLLRLNISNKYRYNKYCEK